MSAGDKVPSVDLGVWRTPVERAPRLAARIGLQHDDLWVKRDDWLGLGGGGSKLRKLEFLCAHALEELGATVLQKPYNVEGLGRKVREVLDRIKGT